MQEYQQKNFEGWIKLKEKIHYGNSTPKITEGDVWWCSCGENVGVEINGKNRLFSRPVLVYKKLSRYGFIGVPLTSQRKTGSWYVNFVFQDKEQTAVLSQIRTFSVSRLSSRMGVLDASDMNRIKELTVRFLK